MPGDRYRPEPRFDALGPAFFDEVEPARFPETTLRFRNDRAAAEVGLEALDDAAWIAHFARFDPLPGNLERPLALRYHGHQFRVYNPAIGDGRGFLFAQLRGRDGRLLDLGTKGSGTTPWSRGGDGRLTLKGGVRELLATEMLEALGVPTSRTFSLVETGERLWRNDEPSPTRACVLVRLSHSHVRVGTFQRHAREGAPERVRALVDHVVEHYFPHLVDAPDRPTAFLAEAVVRAARLAAAFMVAGFVHGVLNSDNQNVTGESFDYGPWRFLPSYDPRFTAAYFDEVGLYAYGRQPEAMAWNVSRLAETLLPLAPQAALEGALEGYGPALREAYRRRLLHRLGLASAGDEAEDDATVTAVVELLAEEPLPFAQLFHDWYGGDASAARAAQSPHAASYEGARFQPVRRRLARHAPLAPARLDDPHFQRAHPPTMLLPEVERVWEAIAERDDWAPLAAKVDEVRAMGRLLALGEAEGGP